MKIFAAVLVLVPALLAAPAADAKGRVSLDVAHSARVGQPVRFALASSWAPGYDLRVIAVAPGRRWYDVVGTVTGDSSLAEADIPRDGFQVRVTAVGAKRWRGVVRFPRAGRWRLVVPCGCERGFSTPVASATVVVR